jgi:hypothetical protein
MLKNLSKFKFDRCCRRNKAGIQRCNKWPRSPPPPRWGLGSENPQGRGSPAGIPEVLPNRGTRVCAPTFLSQHSQHTCTYLNYGTTLMHSYVKLFTLLVVLQVHAISAFSWLQFFITVLHVYSICQVPFADYKIW